MKVSLISLVELQIKTTTSPLSWLKSKRAMKIGKKDMENQNPQYLVMKLQNGAIFLKSFAVPQNLNGGVIIRLI
jgi:hypothetical protein